MSLRTVAGANIRFFRKSNNPAAIFYRRALASGCGDAPEKGVRTAPGCIFVKTDSFRYFCRYRSQGIRLLVSDIAIAVSGRVPDTCVARRHGPTQKINYGLRRKTQNNNPPKSQDECRIPKERRRTHTTQCTKAIPQCDDFRCSSLYVSCRCYATATASVPA